MLREGRISQRTIARRVGVSPARSTPSPAAGAATIPPVVTGTRRATLPRRPGCHGDVRVAVACADAVSAPHALFHGV